MKDRDAAAGTGIKGALRAVYGGALWGRGASGE